MFRETGKRRNAHFSQSMGMVLQDLDSYSTIRSDVETRNNMEMNSFMIIVVSCYINFDRTDICSIGRGLSVERPCARYFSMLEDIQKWGCMRTRTM